MLVVARLAVLVVGAALADARGLGVVAGAHLVRARVHGQGVGVARAVRVGALVAPQAEEPALTGGPVARGVVVCGRGPEALLLLAVAAQGEFCQGGDYEEDAGIWVSNRIRCGWSFWGYSHRDNGNGQDSRLHPAYRHVLGQRDSTIVG